ncbi:MAG TPA: hypothetical protein VIN04_08305 [Myxococcota bacterium]
MRVGTHESHTRIVFELDAAASYRLSPPREGQPVLQIQLDADSAARHVASKSPLVKAVRVQPKQRGSTVFVDLTKDDVEVSEMILSSPPRIVLDVRPAGSGAGLAAVPPAPRAAPPAPAPQPAPAPVPAAAPGKDRLEADGAPVEAAAQEPKVASVPSLSDPIPSDIVAPPAERFTPPAEPAPATADAQAPAAEPSAPSAEPSEPAAVAQAEPASGEATPGDVAAAEAGSGDQAAPAPAAAPEPAAKPAEVVVREPARARPAAAEPETSWAERITSPTGYAAIGGVLLALIVLAVRRRRREEEDDPLYSVMAADHAGDADEDDQDLRGQHEESAGDAWAGSEEAEGEAASAASTSGFDADEPVSRDGVQQLTLGRLRADDDRPQADADADDSLFDGPGAPAIATPPSAPSADGYASDPSNAVGALESRIKELERRIDQLADARERLERQVAAQTEELRVQRAAIARTQRVVRSLTKGEDLATEPVPRAPQA